jgi:hypothetical protein
MKKFFCIIFVSIVLFSAGSAFAENAHISFPLGDGFDKCPIPTKNTDCEVAGEKFADGYFAIVDFGFTETPTLIIKCVKGREVNVNNLGLEYIKFHPTTWTNPDTGHVYRIPGQNVQKYPVPPSENK